MKWGDFRQSDNVEDRTQGAPEGSGGGGGFGIGGMHIGAGALILIVIVGWLFGINPLTMLGLLSGNETPPPPSAPSPGYGPQTSAAGAATQGATTQAAVNKEFSARVLGDTEDVWGAIFTAMGSRYEPPKLVLFRGSTPSACGRAEAAVGPFYCPGDRDVYLDTSFFAELHQRFGAPGDFAQAYVIAHEVGHHVQNLLGTMQKYDAERERANAAQANALSVRLELQADCYAGIWAFFAEKRNLIDTSDVDSGLAAAAAVGDDRIQKMTRGTVAPDSFTHGSSAQRQRWFKTGLQSGDLRDCNTFAAASP
ncbi:MAG TPA: neutral zinc metallopeptidase [Casimicrobiaceae bacterium]|nr:neutral zinc metallopeptidase [Casimicrobiaceae bacterium]